MPFRDRTEAGRRLGAALARLRGSDVVVLGLPRGGVPVAAGVAETLGAPLDVIVVRKLGVPAQPELGMGAIGEGGVQITNPDVLRMARVSPDELAVVEVRERAELERRARWLRRDRPAVPLLGRIAVVVDDGIATGATARAACQVARAQGAARVILAVPVAPLSAAASLAGDVDEFVALETPAQFLAIGEWYADFSQTSDEEVAALLRRAPAAGAGPVVDAEVTVTAGGVQLPGHLTAGPPGGGIVVFAHGSGSSRHSPRNRYVAGVLQAAGLGTLLFDLLTPAEESDRANVFDIALLARRLAGATDWLRAQPAAADAGLGYFGASTGAGAALWAGAEAGPRIGAIVSRGGRPDLAIPRLAEVAAPTLLIVGGHDEVVLELNRTAQSQLRCENELAVVPGATHLFEEPGALEQAAGLARDWFVGHLLRRHAHA